MKASLLRFKQYCHGLGGYFFVTLIGFIIFAIMTALQAELIKMLTEVSLQFNHDLEVSEQATQQIRLIPIYVIGLFTVRAVAGSLALFLSEKASRIAVHRIRSAIFSKSQYIRLQQTDDERSGDMISRVTYNCEQIAIIFTGFFIPILRDGLSVIAMIVYALIIDWQLTMVFFAVMPVIAILTKFTEKFFRRYSVGLQKSVADISEFVAENYRGKEMVRLNNQQTTQSSQFDAVSLLNFNRYMKIIFTRSLSTPTMQLVTALGIAFVIWIALTWQTPIEILLAVFVSLIGCARPVKNLTRVTENLSKAVAALNDVFKYLDRSDEIDSGQEVLEKKMFTITFDQLCFFYEPDTSLFSDFQLSITAGESCALVGASGSGKSSLINLLVRLNNPQSGQVTLNGQPISQYSLQSLRQQIAYVAQKPVLFNGSIYDNIKFGNAQATDADIEQAAELAFVTEFSQHMPLGLQTPVGLEGSNLSGGQQQRVAIARAFVKDAPILLLDEATSALDSHSEQKIQHAIENLMQQRTCIIIAHRLSTITHVDNIVVLDKGRIIEQGSHSQLLDQGGAYSAMLNLVAKP